MKTLDEMTRKELIAYADKMGVEVNVKSWGKDRIRVAIDAHQTVTPSVPAQPEPPAPVLDNPQPDPEPETDELRASLEDRARSLGVHPPSSWTTDELAAVVARIDADAASAPVRPAWRPGSPRG